MFPNNFNMPFYAPYGNMGMPSGLRHGLGSGIGIASRGGLFSKLTGIRSFNWQSLLSNASRTLGVINQAIPIVKQVGPMYNNMKSMLKIASLFKDETDPAPRKSDTINSINNNQNTNNNINNDEQKENTIITNNYSNSPNFFI